MAGALSTHPYVKTYDELQRSVTRMLNYQRTYKKDLSKEAHVELDELICNIQDAIAMIPEEYQITRYKQVKEVN